MALLHAQVAWLLSLISLGLIYYTLAGRYILSNSELRTTKALPSPTSQIPDSVVNATKILLVSAFFPLTISRNADDKKRLSMFLTPVKTHIYFFTSPEMEATIRELRGDLPITINTSFSSPFDIPPLKGVEDHYEEMRAQDRQNNQYPSDLYAAWNSKPYFLDQAVKNMQLGGNTYEYAFWNDARSFRHGQAFSGEWPDRRRVQEIWREGVKLSATPKEDLLFYPMWGTPHPSMRHWVETLGPIDSHFSQGTFFGGPPKAVSWLNKAFYAYHDFYLFRMRAFVGKDQQILNSLFLLFPQRIITVWQNDPDAPEYVGSTDLPLGLCGPPSFYYQFFFASLEDKKLLQAFWKSKIWWPWSWWKDPESCRTTRLLGMEGVLKRQFGDHWVPPTTSIGTLT